MRYLLLSYHNEGASDAAEKERCRDESVELAHRLHASGHYLDAAPLQPIATAVSVRVREGRQLITDGPFAETYEHLGGYFLIEARDLDEAIEIAGQVPGARLGTVEIRPLLPLKGLP